MNKGEKWKNRRKQPIWRTLGEKENKKMEKFEVDTIKQTEMKEKERKKKSETKKLQESNLFGMKLEE